MDIEGVSLEQLFCNNIWPLGGGFVVYSFSFLHFLSLWPFAFLLYFVFLAGCISQLGYLIFNGFPILEQDFK